MTLKEKILALRGRSFVDEDGERYSIKLSPPLSESEIQQIARELPCPLPPDIRELLGTTSGLENGPLESFGFGPNAGFGLEEVFPHALAVAADGWGNYWVADMLPDSTTLGPIFFACHDPAVIVYQCADLGELLDALVEMAQPPYKGPLNFVHEEASVAIWTREPNASSRTDCLASQDPILREFAASLDDEWTVTDLRNAKVGDGFAWGRARSPANIKRCGTLRLFAHRRKKSLWQRLFGR